MSSFSSAARGNQLLPGVKEEFTALLETITSLGLRLLLALTTQGPEDWKVAHVSRDRGR